jgi:hypothetical protein
VATFPSPHFYPPQPPQTNNDRPFKYFFDPPQRGYVADKKNAFRSMFTGLVAVVADFLGGGIGGRKEE